MYTLESHGFQKFKVPKKNFNYLIEFKNLVENTSNSIINKKQKLNNIHKHNQTLNDSDFAYDYDYHCDEHCDHQYAYLYA